MFNFDRSHNLSDTSDPNTNSMMLQPTAVYKPPQKLGDNLGRPNWSLQNWDFRKVTEDTYDIIGVMRREREGKDRYEHWIANWKYQETFLKFVYFCFKACLGLSY